MAQKNLLSRDQTNELVRRVQAGDDQAWKQLVLAHHRLMEKLVANFRHRISCADEDDLRQAARIGMLKAARMFDESRDCKFSTYAFWKMRGEICNIMRSQGLIRLPQTRSNKDRDDLPHVVASLDEPIPGAVDVTFADAVVDPEIMEENILSRIESEQFMLGIEKALSGMEELRRKCFVLRFGLDGEEPRSFREIARILEVNRGTAQYHTKMAVQALRQSVGQQP